MQFQTEYRQKVVINSFLQGEVVIPYSFSVPNAKFSSGFYYCSGHPYSYIFQPTFPSLSPLFALILSSTLIVCSIAPIIYILHKLIRLPIFFFTFYEIFSHSTFQFEHFLIHHFSFLITLHSVCLFT